MVKFERFTLSNGLRVIVHEDHTTPMAVLNVLYDVGARDEDEQKTGFAHLFEHLMFGGSINIPSYDEPLQRVGGENNAFTSNDITNYYITLPAVNIETAFWLESDRMLDLAFSEKSLDVQRNVVSEEFKQRYLNQPYGDVWLKLRPLVYNTHPYKWATIGKELKHIEEATIEDVKGFFKKHYNPANAILVVGGDVTFNQVEELANKWFGSIPSGLRGERNLPVEPEQKEFKSLTVKADVPLNAIYMAFKMPGRLDPDFHAYDLLSDVLSLGQSSRLHQHLVKEQQLFSDINAYITSSIDPGMFVIEGRLISGVTVEVAEKAIWAEIELLLKEGVSEHELIKVKNKGASIAAFNRLSLLDRAMDLAYHELLGDADGLNHEVDKYAAVTTTQIKKLVEDNFAHEKCSILYYLTND